MRGRGTRRSVTGKRDGVEKAMKRKKEEQKQEVISECVECPFIARLLDIR